LSQNHEGESLAPTGSNQIQWLPWGGSAFAQAQAENKPVLLSIGAVWCYWCHVMDEATYVDPEVADYVNNNFVSVRVDNDHRPDINLRYNVGGWPSTVFLTGHGGYIAGATYLPPDQLLAMLMEVQRTYRDQKPEVYDQGNSLLRQRREEVAKIAAGAELGEELVDRIARRVAGTYDPRNGGFGEAPKFPGVPILSLLLHLFRTTREEFYRVMLVKTLDGMAASPFFDQAEGGFFRYSPAPDWSEAQHEKMLEDNIGLARIYLEAYLLLEQDRYREVASRTIDYLMNNLYDDEARGFRGSQGAHSDYFGLPKESRQGQPSPPVDLYCYSSWSAQAVSLLLSAAWKLRRPELRLTALNVLAKLDAMAQTGRLSHIYSVSSPPKPAASSQLLTDWACLLNALMDAASYAGDSERYLERAKAVALILMAEFGDTSNGGFFDVDSDSEAVGHMRVREKPLPENVAAAQGLLKLHQATGDETYRETAQRTLSAYVEANRVYGEFAASYALTVDLALNEPIEVTIEGHLDEGHLDEGNLDEGHLDEGNLNEGHLENPDTQAMLRAAAQVTYPNIVVKLVEALAENQVVAHVCLNTVCLPPVSDPSELALTVAEAVAPEASSFENIFQQFGGL